MQAGSGRWLLAISLPALTALTAVRPFLAFGRGFADLTIVNSDFRAVL
jgi:hypothetical protein